MVEDMVAKVLSGKSITPVESVEKIYNVSSHNSAKHISSVNMNNPDFRAAFLEAFRKRDILGENSLVETRLEEGLDATDREGSVDYGNRLKYIQEINKIAGVYAPQRVEKKTMSLNLDMTEEELDAKIQELKQELSE